jgi:UDP-glucose 4-epimerase
MSEHKIRALIVGGAGYIGCHIAHDLAATGVQVTVFDNLSTGHVENIPLDSTFIQGDLLNPADINTALATRPDVVFHFAAKKAVGESMLKPGLYARNNISGTLNLLAGMMDHSIDRFVFSSSAAVYGSPVTLPIDEQHPCRPENYYGYTKLAIEENLAWFSMLKNFRYTSLRYFNAAGYDIHQRVRLRELETSNLTPIIMEAASSVRDGFQVFGDDYETRDGTCIRDYIHVNDLSSAHLLAMHHLLECGDSLVLNLGTATGTTVSEIILAAEKILGKQLNYKVTARRHGDPATLIASSDLAQQTLGWSPQYSSIETILDSMRYIYGLDDSDSHKNYASGNQ